MIAADLIETSMCSDNLKSSGHQGSLSSEFYVTSIILTDSLMNILDVTKVFFWFCISF